MATTPEELRIAAIGSKIEFAKSELQTVHAGRVRVATDDGSELPIDCLAHLGSVLSNYEQMLFDQIADLEYQQELLRFPPDKKEDREDDGISDNQDT
ncbi:hypothetical protein N2597_11475 [Rhizobium sophoriradicis]|uniref:hypothetical protein n=1 Tax=Rhizobium sophoriradicis TaxID=1535245 RepID=UPI0018020F23|nr:hypothetical protein N2597_11475 [Rhizobium leguminosarum bv. phaseoli]